MPDDRPTPARLRLNPGQPGPWISRLPVSQPPEQLTPARSRPPLSPTEIRVYHMLIERMTERQIAERMGRSPNTVHVHVRNIYRKLVCNRKDLLILAGAGIDASDQAERPESQNIRETG